MGVRETRKPSADEYLQEESGVPNVQTDACWPFIGLRLTVPEGSGPEGALPLGSWSEPAMPGEGQCVDT